MSRFMGWWWVYNCDKGGYHRNQLCMYSNGDLPTVSKLPYFLLNKFQLKDDPIAYSCMEDFYSRRLRRESVLMTIGETSHLDMTPYCQTLYNFKHDQVYKGCANFTRNW